MKDDFAKDIIKAGGFLLLPAKDRIQMISNSGYPLPETPDRNIWYEFYNMLGVSELAQFFLVENDIHMILGETPANFKLKYVNNRLKLITRDVKLDRRIFGNLSTESYKLISGIPYFWSREHGIYLNCHHIDGNHRNDTSSNLGLIRASRHGQVHNSRCTLNLNTAPCIPLAHLTNNKFGIDWLITENGIERSKSYKPLDVERDVFPLLDQIEKGGFVSQYKTIEDLSMKKMVTQKTL